MGYDSHARAKRRSPGVAAREGRHTEQRADAIIPKINAGTSGRAAKRNRSPLGSCDGFTCSFPARADQVGLIRAERLDGNYLLAGAVYSVPALWFE
jgi:hypothetical protein